MPEEKQDMKLRGFNRHKQRRAQVIKSISCIRKQQTLWRARPENLNPCDKFYLWYPGTLILYLWFFPGFGVNTFFFFLLSFLDHPFFVVIVTWHRHSLHWSRRNSYNLGSVLPFAEMQNNHKTFYSCIDVPYYCCLGASLVAQRIKRLPAMQVDLVQSLDQEDPLEKEMATHSSTFARKIPWTEEPGRLQSMGSQRVRHNWGI